jgi:gamma-glutamyltranspeptidase/glutathione hydrolase
VNFTKQKNFKRRIKMKKVSTKLMLISLFVVVLTATSVCGVLAKEPSTRPDIRGMDYVVAAGHWLAAKVGANILDKGGNMADAGVATVLAQAVLEPNANFSLGGEGGILIYLANEQTVKLISGMGISSKMATIDFYIDNFGGIPETIAAAAVPGIFDCLMVALDKYGTMSFEEVVEGPLQLAERGFPMYRGLSASIQAALDKGVILKYPESVKIYLPGGKVPQTGEVLTNPGLAKLFRKFIAEEKFARAQGKSRTEVFQAIRDVFYKGYVAKTIDQFMKEQGIAEGGLLRYEDFVHYGELPKEEEPWTTNYRGYDIYAHGAWSQGPCMLMALNILEGFDLSTYKPNSPELVHLITEILKLVLADRHAYLGDPRFSEIPQKGLLSKEYAAERRALIDLTKCTPEFAPGDPWKYQGTARLPVTVPNKTVRVELARLDKAAQSVSVDDIESMDTTAMSLIDKNRNMFNCTPSTYGGLARTACVPGDVGFLLNTRLLQLNLIEGNPNQMEPWKRPRLTPQSYMAIKDGKPVYAWNTPGGDTQVQFMLQAIVYALDFGMSPQDALDMPCFQTAAFPSGEYPNTSVPSSLSVVANMGEETIEGLKKLGHDVKVMGAWSTNGGVMVKVEPTGTVVGGAVRSGEKRYVIGW